MTARTVRAAVSKFAVASVMALALVFAPALLPAGRAIPAAKVLAQTAEAVLPAAPVSVSAAAGNGTATVMWEAPASDGGSPIFGYVLLGDPAGATVTPVDGRMTVVHGLTNGQPYTFRVAALNRVGLGPFSEASNAVAPSASAPAVPGSPSDVSALFANGVATVNWRAPASTGSSEVIAYIVLGRPTGAAIVTGNTTNTVLTGLTDGISYSFKVAAINRVGLSLFSEPSAPVTVAVPQAPPASQDNVSGPALPPAGEAAPGDPFSRSSEALRELVERQRTEMSRRIEQAREYLEGRYEGSRLQQGLEKARERFDRDLEKAREKAGENFEKAKRRISELDEKAEKEIEKLRDRAGGDDKGKRGDDNGEEEDD